MQVILAALLFFAGSVAATPLSAAPRNILLILADDYGIDVTRYYPTSDRRATTPSAPATPNLAALARAGVIFRNAWAEPSCSPTRATIFTGRYAFRTGIGKPVPADLSSPPPVLSVGAFSLPEAFAASGRNYYLAHIGKWHLSRGIDDPRIHGWPRFSGPHPNLAHLPDYYDWPKVVDGVEVDSHAPTYATTDQVNDTLAAMGAARTAGQPFFIWLALSAPHSPYQKPPNNLHTRDSLPIDSTPSRALRRSYYEATIEAMDTEIGRLLSSVDLATTTVIFLGDNGTPNEVTASPYDENHAKLRVYEQGVRVPMIVAGSGLRQPGRKLTQLVNTVDIWPTILQLAGIDPATVLAGRRIDGVSFLRYIDNSSTAAIRPWAFAEKFDLLWNERTEYAIRDPRYKLIERVAGLKWPVREFFDLRNDPYEKNNLLNRTLTSAQRKKLNNLNTQLDRLIATR